MSFYDEKNFSIERSVGFLLNTLAGLINEELDGLLKAHLGVTLAQWRALSILQLTTTASASAICAELNHDSGAMTRMLDKLEALDLVAREDDESDRRAHKLRLTGKGLVVFRQGFEMARENLNRSMADLSETEGEQLIALLQKVKQTTLAAKKAGRQSVRSTK